MTRRARWIVASVVVGSLMGILSPAASAARDPVEVKIGKGQVELQADGSVLVPIRVRCQPPLQAFEVDVSVGQEGVFGSTFMLAPGIIPCDGRWHSMTVEVTPDEGSFGPGPATVDVFVGAFDPDDGIDVEGRATVTVRL